MCVCEWNFIFIKIVESSTKFILKYSNVSVVVVLVVVVISAIIIVVNMHVVVAFTRCCCCCSSCHFLSIL